MKRKDSFVTNSSSTSFLIHGFSESIFDIAYISEYKFKKLVKNLKKVICDILIEPTKATVPQSIALSKEVFKKGKLFKDWSNNHNFWVHYHIFETDSLNHLTSTEYEAIKYKDIDIKIETVWYYETSEKNDSIIISITLFTREFYGSCYEINMVEDVKKIIRVVYDILCNSNNEDIDYSSMYTQMPKYSGDGWNNLQEGRDITFTFDLFNRFSLTYDNLDVRF